MLSAIRAEKGVRKMEILKTHQDFEALRWLHKAINPKHANEALRCIYVKNGVAVATDGHRLHKAQVSIDDGLFTVIKSTAKEMYLALATPNNPFPNYEMILPKEKRQVFMPKLTENGIHHSIAAIIRDLSDEWAVNIDFLKEALSIDNEWTLYIATQGNTEQVWLESKKCQALIMPLKN